MDDAVSITVAVTIVITVGFVQEYRSEKSIEALNHLVPNHAHLVRAQSTKTSSSSKSGSWPPAVEDTIEKESSGTETPGEEMMEATSTKVMATQLVPGDLVMFTTGDRIPADIRVTKAADLTIDASNLTGENEPVRVTADARARIGLLQGKKILELFTISISLAVAAIPEGLPIIVTVTLALGVHRMAKHNAIIRRMPSVETLGSVNVVCSDKTGTLTMNHMTTANMWHFGKNRSIDIQSDDGDFSKLTRWVGQPTDVAMLDLLDRFEEHDVRHSIGPRTAETPFSSERKWMGVVIGADPKHSEREYAYMKGAIDRVLDACDSYLTPDGREVVLDSTRRNEALEAAERMAEKGLRVLAFASGPVTKPSRSRSTLTPSTRSSTPGDPDRSESPLPQNEELYKGLTFAGLVGMSDPPRPGVAHSIRRLMRGGVKVIMITGDSPTTAFAIGSQLGMQIATPREHSSNQVEVKPVLTGDEVDAMTEDQLAAAMQATTIFARTNPDHKMKIIGALQSRGDIVAMTGDGVNDAPALKKADIGISMGMHGTDVAKEASDMILTDDDFSTILRAIEEGKGIFNNIQNFITFQLSTSVASLALVFLCTCMGLKTPLNAMQILWINIIMDGPPAQSLGVEKVDPDVMTRPPRSRSEPVLTRSLLQRVLTSATIIMAGTMLVYTREMLSDGEVDRRDTTMTFTCFVLFDMFNALACRTEGKSFLAGEVGWLSNRLFNWAVALSLAGQLLVIYFPWLQEVFQTEALGPGDLLRLVVLASSVFWVDEARKWMRYGRWKRGVGGAAYSQAV
ncbi:putative calcium-transporting p-type atpase protein [Eutypa lata UCREL1]|uniref:Putative calcium-transporting P-type atpase protein n=1 Tax=Eutypa lata (strain UCR-EL1) TaxID=1287681 RepID=M7SY35_EUTLA|nr:putative calcium-transporting p-type atpase protein [Eutypa lata UCREL1]